MTITPDTSARFPAVADTTTDVAISTAYAVGASATLLVAAVNVIGTTTRTGGSPTYNAIAMTQVATTQVGDEMNVELWYLLNPATGSNLIAVPNDNGRSIAIYISSYNPTVGNTFNAGNTGTADTSGSNPTVNIISSAGHLVVATVVSGDNGFNPSAQTGTELFNDDYGVYGAACQYLVAAGAVASMSWTEATSDDYAAVAIEFSEFSGELPMMMHHARMRRT